MNSSLRILMLGDIIGKPGRRILSSELPDLIKKKNIDLVGANGENLAGGFGITEKTANKLFSYGVNFITSGNHIWDRRDGYDVLESDPRILRPANYPEGSPGKGFTILKRKDYNIGIINVQGRTFLIEIDCPFRKSDELIAKLKEQNINIILVDIHAETTSEKSALGWYLDGRVSAVVGTHTHVQTSDNRILNKGTAYITDIGMCGGRDSVIGMRKEIAIKRYLTHLPERFKTAQGVLMINGVIIDIDKVTGKAINIERVWIEENGD